MLCYLFHAKKATTSSFPSSAMIRATRSTSSRIRSSDKYIRMGLPKGFFWSANNSNGDDGEDNDGRGRKKEAGEVKNGETKTATSGDTTADVTTSSHKEEGVYKNKRRSSSTSTTNRFTRRIQEHYPHNNDILWTSSGFSGSSTTSSSNGSSSSSSTFLPSYQGYGESSPRFPHLIGLPVIHRPIFPGVPANITITDKATIDAIEQLTSKGPAYLGVFLRKSGADGLLEGGLGVIEHPEIITDINDIYSVGTFAQIHRFQREMGIDPSTLHATTFGSSNLAVRRRAHNDNKPTTHNNHHKGSKHIHRIQQEEDEKDMDHDTHEQQQEEEEQNDDDNHEDQREGATAASLLLLAHRRIDLISIDNYGPPIDITVKHWDRLDYNPRGDTATEDMIKALTNEVLSSIREIAATSPMFREQISRFPLRVDTSNPYALADFAASISMGSPAEHQAILEERDAEKRLHKALLLLSKEREVSKLQQEISRKVEEKMTDQQRRYLLMEQLKSIKKELGMEVDDKEALIDKYKKKVQNKAMVVPDDVMKVIDSELEKLSTLEKNSSEFNVTRSYLDWLTDIPWGVTSDETFDIVRARKILDRDHYGLDQVKDTILQFIAVGKLKGSVSQGSILILWGPPGTGKTSVAQSVAEALGRKFFRFSVGGLGDVSEIKGHRRTYVGAMPGKFIQGLKSAGTCNPLILIDEIDKLGRDFRGDPASALLEVLDPSQNSTFLDHFLDVPVDMSKVLFMCTANDLENIPGPLRDRMEAISLTGYDVPEKVAIAEQYLVPKCLKKNGLMVEPAVASVGDDGDNKSAASVNQLAASVPSTLKITTSAIESLVRWYCREAGVRNLEKHIDKITRKLALQVIAEKEGAPIGDKMKRKSDTWEVSEKNLADYVGKPLFTSDRMYEKDPLPNGIVMGLAWTSMGGSALYVETQGIHRGLDTEGKRRGGGTLKCTGQLGNVMSESTQIAYTVARSRLFATDSTNSYFDDNDIHMHVPEGATPKDGPSAGITMVTSMLSLAMDKPVRSDLAMTGEISLTGKVLPVGGIREKTMAAKRAGVTCLIFPEANKRDFEDLPEYLKEGLEVHFADDYSKVFYIAFNLKE